jgi:membrane-associated phospholipid phosphatase
VYRLEAASGWIRRAVPPVLTDAFALVTELGGVAFLLVSLSVLYWVWDREASATVVGFALVAAAVTASLKTGLAFPRPPATVHAVAGEAGSHGFPSGHATAATAVYGGLALVSGRLRDRRVAAATVLLVGLIALSRVVLGVHYLGDVLAGVAVGAAIPALLRWGGGARPDRACLVAAGCVLPAIAMGGGRDALLVLGASLGGALAFRGVDATRPVPSSPARRAALVTVGLPAAGGLYLLASIAPVGPAVVAGSGAVVTCVVGLPAAVRGLLESVGAA